MEPILLELLREESWQRMEERIWEAAAVVLRHQNELNLGPSIPVSVRPSDNPRHHLACDFGGIGRTTAGRVPARLQALHKNEVSWLHDRQLILWNEEAGKWTLFLQKDRSEG